ncbi:hypothetical protein PTTG_11404 [Puccinia triticina 1-1 BBBD Race 1]|uniref:Uncharacterized protein n=1 Tax=Puccinia triticina (isolate 1-1 / race 1 (BBBD)) TaxID=630390 RepID=A0A180H496_PUCT1|nr:hypothetical protein PTTG_11404 [Puccinia triticina 1-1 BBBD Race 1]
MARPSKRLQTRSTAQEDETNNTKKEDRAEDHAEDCEDKDCKDKDCEEEGNSSGIQLTDEQRLEHAVKLSCNRVSSAYASYELPPLSSHLDKFQRHMIAWQSKQQKNPDNKTLAACGVMGTGEIDPREVLQRCAVWCAEVVKPFSALEDGCLKQIIHPTILRNLPNRKVVSQAIHTLYLCVQEKLHEELKAHIGALYLGVDAWQTPNGYDIIGAVVYQLVDKAAGNVKVNAMPLDFAQLKERHTGQYLACVV